MIGGEILRAFTPAGSQPYEARMEPRLTVLQSASLRLYRGLFHLSLLSIK